MKRSIKFIWGASRRINGHWYLGLFGFYDRNGQRDQGMAISVRGMLGWLSGFAVIAYVAAAAALFYIWQNNSHSLLSFQDAILYPIRRTEIAEKKGQAFIVEGMDLFRAKKYHDAANLLRLGLTRYPRDLNARLTLARYYELANQRPSAIKVLTEGLTTEFPGRAYLTALLNTAQQDENYDLAVSVGNRYLPRLREERARDHPWLLGRQFSTLLAAERPEDALALAAAEPASDTTTEYRLLAQLALQRPDEALALLTDWRARPGADLRTVTRLDVRAFREAKRFDAMEQALAQLRALEPSDPSIAVYAVVQQALTGRVAVSEQAFDDFVFRFGGSASNLLLAAQPLAEIGNVALLQRCIAAATERGYPLQHYFIYLVQVHLQRGEWEAAHRTLVRMPAEAGPEAAAAKLWRDWTQALIDAMGHRAGNASQVLVEFLRSYRWTMEIYRRTITALVVTGEWELARDVISLAARNFPASRWLETQGSTVAAMLAAKPAPPAEPANGTATPAIFVEGRVMERLEEHLKSGQWDDAARLIREVRALRPTPSWLVARDPAFSLAQVRIYHAHGNSGGILAATESYLNGSDERADALLQVAQTFVRDGDKRTAITLAKEILRRSPTHRATQAALVGWQPPAPKKAADAIAAGEKRTP